MLKEIEDKIKFRQQFTEYVNIVRSICNKEKLSELSKLRNIDLEEIEKCGIFYVEDNATLIIPQYFDKLDDFGVISQTNKRPIYENRWVIPIKDENGLVQSLVGYSNLTDERYVYATTKYYMRADTLWGLENIELAYEMGYAILVEGITDAIHIRSIGYPNTFASCGTRESDINMRQLNRCEHGIVRIPDRDKAGYKTKKHWVTNRYVTLNTPIQYKDSDETLKNNDNLDWFKGYLDSCIGWLKQDKHRGKVCPTIEATML